MSDSKNFKLVPASMHLDRETISAINFHCGDGGDNFGKHPRSEVVRDVVVSPLYTAPPELAELQATIARLTAEIETLRLNLDLQHVMGENSGNEIDQLKSEIERLKGGQSEPVALARGEQLHPHNDGLDDYRWKP